MMRMRDIPVVGHCLRAGAKAAAGAGIVAEFGVYRGTTIRQLANMFPDEDVYGFDSFVGLPEPWVRSETSVYPAGRFSLGGQMPDVPQNVLLVPGWFHEALPAFLDVVARPFKLMHIDCDLYSSTKTLLALCRARIVPGTVLVFDELCDWSESGRYPAWPEGEYRALVESGLRFRPLARDNRFALAIQIEETAA